MIPRHLPSTVAEAGLETDCSRQVPPSPVARSYLARACSVAFAVPSPVIGGVRAVWMLVHIPRPVHVRPFVYVCVCVHVCATHPSSFH